jgi:hypothetical protein
MPKVDVRPSASDAAARTAAIATIVRFKMGSPHGALSDNSRDHAMSGRLCFRRAGHNRANDARLV